MLLNRERGIQETFDFEFAVIELVLHDAVGVNTHLVNHATRGVLKVGIIFEEISMPENVRYHKRILQ